MNAIAERIRLTFDEYLHSEDRFHCELEDGFLVEKFVSNQSSFVANNIAFHLTGYCRSNALGVVFNSEVIYRCFPDHPETSRRPDVSFIRNERLPEGWIDDSHFAIAPDLAVEVVSPNDLAYEVDRKIQQYLKAGVSLVWVVNPEERLVHVHRHDGSVGKWTKADMLSGETMAPGFSCPVSELFLPKA